MLSHSFTPKFFERPAPIVEVPLSFPLPTSIDTLKEFLQSDAGQYYRQGVKELVQALRVFTETQGFFTPEIETKLSDFCAVFHNSGSQDEINKHLFSLMTDGVYQLHAVVDLLTSSKLPMHQRCSIIKNMIEGIAVCGPGSITNICSARLSLLSDPANMLMVARKSIIEQVATEEFQQVLKRGPHSDLLQPGNEIHFVNLIRNTVAELYAIDRIDDIYIPPLSDHIVNRYQKRVLSIISQRMTPLNIVIFLYTRLDLHNLINKLNHYLVNNPGLFNDAITDFENGLNDYGRDERFNCAELFDFSEGAVSLKANFYEQLLLTIYRRLVQQGFFVNYVKEVVTQDENILLEPQSIYFSAKITREGMIPLLPICINEIMNGNKHTVARLPFAHHVELQKIIFHMQIPVEKKLTYLAELPPLPDAVLIDILCDMPPSERNPFLSLVSHLNLNKVQSIIKFLSILPVSRLSESIAFGLLHKLTALSQKADIITSVAEALYVMDDERFIVFIGVKYQNIWENILTDINKFIHFLTNLDSTKRKIVIDTRTDAYIKKIFTMDIDQLVSLLGAVDNDLFEQLIPTLIGNNVLDLSAVKLSILIKKLTPHKINILLSEYEPKDFLQAIEGDEAWLPCVMKDAPIESRCHVLDVYVQNLSQCRPEFGDVVIQMQGNKYSYYEFAVLQNNTKLLQLLYFTFPIRVGDFDTRFPLYSTRFHAMLVSLAIQNEDASLFQELHEKAVNLYEMIMPSFTVLHYIADRKFPQSKLRTLYNYLNYEQCLRFIEGLDNNSETNVALKSMLLHMAIRQSDVQLIKLLLQKKTSIVSLDAENLSPLTAAIRYSNPHVVALLQAASADPFSREGATTPFIEALLRMPIFAANLMTYHPDSCVHALTLTIRENGNSKYHYYLLSIVTKSQFSGIAGSVLKNQLFSMEFIYGLLRECALDKEGTEFLRILIKVPFQEGLLLYRNETSSSPLELAVLHQNWPACIVMLEAHMSPKAFPAELMTELTASQPLKCLAEAYLTSISRLSPEDQLATLDKLASSSCVLATLFKINLTGKRNFHMLFSPQHPGETIFEYIRKKIQGEEPFLRNVTRRLIKRESESPQ